MKKTPSWLPAPVRKRPTPPEKKYEFESGEPELLELLRYHADDHELRAHEQIACCKCGLDHLHEYAVYRKGRKWFLRVTSFQIDEPEK